MGRKTWSPSQDALVRSLWIAEVSVAQIAHKVGHTESAVKGRRVTLGLRPRRNRLEPRSYSLRLEASLLRELRHRARDRSCGLSTLIRRVLLRECGMG